MSEKSKYTKYEEATRHYYGADRDPLRIVPVVTDKEVAHTIALEADRQLDAITEEDLTRSALLVQRGQRFRPAGQRQDLKTLQEEALDGRVRTVVMNTELTHARLAPGNFNEDAEQSSAYQGGIGHVIELPRPEDPQR